MNNKYWTSCASRRVTYQWWECKLLKAFWTIIHATEYIARHSPAHVQPVGMCKK